MVRGWGIFGLAQLDPQSRGSSLPPRTGSQTQPWGRVSWPFPSRFALMKPEPRLPAVRPGFLQPRGDGDPGEGGTGVLKDLKTEKIPSW